MPLPSSGAISLSQVNTELGRSSTATISLNESAVRTLFGVASGAISMSQGYGKANQFSFAISSNQTQANLRTLAVNAGWNGTSKVIATINSGIYVSSGQIGTPALTINGSFPNGVELTNNGFIIGMGGAGGPGGAPANGYRGYGGSAGGAALAVSSAVAVRNNGTIGGGGGGGGGGASGPNEYGWTGGGGGGGGRTGASANSLGGAGASGNNPPANSGYDGGNGTVSAPGAGGGVKFTSEDSAVGGPGGQWGASGAVGASLTQIVGGPGGAGGAAITGNSNITYLATGTRLGAIT